MSDRIVFSCDRAEIEGLLLHGGLPTHILAWSPDDHQEGVVESILQRILESDTPLEWEESVVECLNELDGDPTIVEKCDTRVGGYHVLIRSHSESGACFWFVKGNSATPFSVSAGRVVDSIELAKSDAIKAIRALVAVFGEMPR